MLSYCKKCRNTKEIKIKAVGANVRAIMKEAMTDTSSLKPVCTTCGEEVELSEFAVKGMIQRKEFILSDKGRTSKVQCHGCQAKVEIKLDKKDNPRCLRCATIVKITPFMVKSLKTMGRYLTAGEESSMGI